MRHRSAGALALLALALLAPLLAGLPAQAQCDPTNPQSPVCQPAKEIRLALLLGGPRAVLSPQPTPTLDVPSEMARASLRGEVLVAPRSATSTETTAPIDYVIVFDESYSMGWRWEDARAPSVTETGRIAIAKEALRQFVTRQLHASDRMAIVSFGRGAGNTGTVMPYPSDKVFPEADITAAMNAVTSHVIGYTWGDASGKAALLAAIDGLQRQGTTPTALGLERARRLIAADGRLINIPEMPAVRQKLILITDGPANVYLDGKFNRCPDGMAVAENCLPHLASAGQPIDQMGDVAEQIRAQFGSTVTTYVIALGAHFDTVGLDRVASSPQPPFFNRADKPDDLGPIFDSFAAELVQGCVPSVEPPQPPLDPSRIVDGAIGEVSLRDSAGSLLATTDLISRNGAVTYHFELLRTGDFLLSGVVRYRGADGVARTYNLLQLEGGQVASSVAVRVGYDTATAPLPGPTLTFVLGSEVCAAR
jgi:hypothetical protein